MLVLSAADIERALPMHECIDEMEKALTALSRGEVTMPLRSAYRPPEAQRRAMAWMPAYRAGEGSAFSAKLLCLVADNPARGLDAHQGIVALFDGETGEPRAILNASALTAIRTAAVSAAATRVLANPGPARLAIIGAGVQARAHLHALPLVREIRSVAIASRTGTSAATLAQEVAAEVHFPVEAAPSAEAAVRDADIVVTVTSATSPVIARSWLKPGAHINAVGMRHELDVETVAAARLFTDRRESIVAEAPEFQHAREGGVIGDEHVLAELGEIFSGEVGGRTSTAEITLFRSLGVAAEDLFAACHAVTRAREVGAGTDVEI